MQEHPHTPQQGTVQEHPTPLSRVLWTSTPHPSAGYCGQVLPHPSAGYCGQVPLTPQQGTVDKYPSPLSRVLWTSTPTPLSRVLWTSTPTPLSRVYSVSFVHKLIKLCLQLAYYFEYILRCSSMPTSASTTPIVTHVTALTSVHFQIVLFLMHTLNILYTLHFTQLRAIAEKQKSNYSLTINYIRSHQAFSLLHPSIHHLIAITAHPPPANRPRQHPEC